MLKDAVTNWDLGAEWAAWRAGHPGTALRHDAHMLGVSEAELVATGCGSTATRLCGGWIELLRGLQELGPVVLQTESDGSLIEARGVVVPAAWSARQGTLRVGASRIRVDLDHWYHGFAVREDRGHEVRNSLQFFDADGKAVHRIELDRETLVNRWAQLVQRFASADQRPWLVTTPVGPDAGMVPDAAVDVRALHARWDDPKNPRALNDFLRKHGIPRGQAVRLAGPRRAEIVPTSTFKVAIRCASNAMLPVSLAVESPGVQHSYIGMIRRVESRREALVVIEPGLRAFIAHGKIATAWLVRRPTPTGVMSSLQYFDAADQPVLVVGAPTLPGEPGVERWERLIAGLR